MVLTNFAVRKLTPAELELAKGLWADGEFLPTDEYWLAEFEIGGLKRQAGIRWGRRVDVAADMQQFDVQLRINQEELDEDIPLIAEAQVADIVKAVAEEFEKFLSGVRGSHREKAVAMFVREHGATSHHLREDGALIMTRGSGKKMVQLKVTASALATVEERIRTHVPPFRHELQATLLGTKTRKATGKPNRGKR